MVRRLPDRPIEPRALESRSARAHRLGLDAEVSEVLARWRLDAAHSEQTLLRTAETVGRFCSRVTRLGVVSFADVTPGQARDFILAPTRYGSPPSLATRHARRMALRTLYKTLRDLGITSGDPTLDIALPPRGELAARPLTDDEVTLCRVMAQPGAGQAPMQRCVAWALGEASAVSSEITTITVADLDDAGDPRSVRLPGTRRHEPREAALTSWGARIIAARIAHLNPADGSALLAYGGQAPPGGAKAQASVCNALRSVLDLAGLAHESDIRPASLRHWAGRRAYDAGASIDQVAILLGHRSLDETATDIALDWRGTREAK